MKKNIILLLLLLVAFYSFKKEERIILWLGNSLNQFQPPVSPRESYNFNSGWKFSFGDSTGADQPGFDDSKWSTISLPHTWNDTDTYRAYISHGGGDQSEKMFGIGWYRKHFTVPANAKGQKVFLQFDGMRQAGRFFIK